MVVDILIDTCSTILAVKARCQAKGRGLGHEPWPGALARSLGGGLRQGPGQEPWPVVFSMSTRHEGPLSISGVDHLTEECSFHANISLGQS